MKRTIAFLPAEPNAGKVFLGLEAGTAEVR